MWRYIRSAIKRRQYHWRYTKHERTLKNRWRVPKRLRFITGWREAQDILDNARPIQFIGGDNMFIIQLYPAPHYLAVRGDTSRFCETLDKAIEFMDTRLASRHCWWAIPHDKNAMALIQECLDAFEENREEAK